MLEIKIWISGCPVGQPQAQEISRLLAAEGNRETICLARYNREADACSPCCLKGKLGAKPGWEIYGEKHGGRLKISVNDGNYIFIFS